MTRRKKGTGSLRHLGGERYEFSIRHQGRAHSRVLYAKNMTEANKRANTVASELLGNPAKTSDKRRYTVDQYVELYFAEAGDVLLAPKTRAGYRTIASHRVSPYIGNRRMEDVTPNDLKVLYKKLESPGARRDGRSGGLSSTSIHHTHRFVHRLFAWAVEQGHLATNPADRARPHVKQQTKAPAVLDLVQVDALLDSLRASRARGGGLYMPVLMAAWMGLRRSEALAMRWSDIDVGEGMAVVRRTVTQTRDDGVVVADRTKTGKTRSVPLDSDMLAELQAHRRRQLSERMRLGRGWQGARRKEDDYICARPDGSIWPPDAFQSTFAAYRRAHGFDGVTYHGLRHSFGSQLAAIGYESKTRADIMGHSEAVNEKVYTTAFAARKRQAMDDLRDARRAARGTV